MSALPARETARQSGVALITVLLMVALLTAIVSRLSLSTEVWMRQVQNSNALAQARQATQAAQIWVMSILDDDDTDYDGNTDNWAQPIVPIPVAWGEVYGWIEDMQGGFNVNNLIDDEGNLNTVSMLQFERLLSSLELDPGIAQSIADWIDADSESSGPGGAEDLYYLSQEAPYLASNRPVLDLNELKLVRGMDQEVWNKLTPHISALPIATTVNINSTSPEVLAAMILDPQNQQVNLLSQTRRWLDDVETVPFTSMEEFTEMVGDQVNPEGLRSIGVSSSFFRAHTQINFGNVEYRMLTLYQREGRRSRILQHSREIF
jgi:general secretion pathway protein K